MAKESGWWKLDCTVEPDDSDLEHIAELIKEGYVEGEICADDSDEEECEDEE